MKLNLGYSKRIISLSLKLQMSFQPLLLSLSLPPLTTPVSSSVLLSPLLGDITDGSVSV